MAHYSSSSSVSASIGAAPQPGLGLCNDYWKIEKVLTETDVSDHHHRLLLWKRDVVNHILPLMQGSDADQCSSGEGLDIKVWDADTSGQFELRLKMWPSAESYVLTKKWITDFVVRRELQAGDKVGFTYIGSTLYFKHLN